MKTLVAYISKTGNTKKVAEAIFGEIQGEKEIKPIKEVDSLVGYDLVFLGFPVEKSGPTKDAVRFLQNNTRGVNVALFITHSSPEHYEEVPTYYENFKKAAVGANIVGLFDCQGQLSKTAKFVMRVQPFYPKIRNAARLDNSQGQPDAARLEKARAFARKIIKKLSR